MMKNKLLLLFAILAMVVSASAEESFSATNAEGVTIYYKTINSSTCQVTYNNSYTSLTSVNIPSTVTYNATKYSVTWIGGSAFYNCSNLTSVTIPESVTDIRPSAFEKCTGLTTVSIPNSVTTISYDAFNGCTGLTSVVIGDHVTSVGEYAFKNCSKLAEITSLATTPPTLDSDCFSGIASGCKLIVPNAAAVTAYSSKDGWSDFSSNILSAGQIIYYTYSDGEGVKPKEGAFFDSEGNALTVTSNTYSDGKGMLVLSGEVTEIGAGTGNIGAFESCTGLTSVTIPNSVTTIGNYAFYHCSGLTSVTIPSSVTSIGKSAFNSCSKLTSVTIPNSVTSIGDNAFNGCSGLTSVTIPNSVTSIGTQAFFNCKGLTSVEIPNSVTSIEYGAFAFCGKLTSVEIPNSVTSIGQSAFYNCTGLTSVTIPSSVTSIGGYAFSGCSKLESVDIPNSVTTIGDYAFKGCSTLAEITSLATTPPNLGKDCFNNIASGYTIKVPNISVSAYQGATNWSAYASNISALDRSLDVTISSAGLATLWLEYDATVPANAEVYYAKDFDNVASTVKMTKITGNLPRETGVIVKGAADTYTFNEADTEGEKVTSMLVGSETAQTFEETGYKFYKLTYDNDGENLGFYLANEAGTIVSKPHKAYLRLPDTPAAAPARGISIDWGNETTKIESVADFKAESGTMYNLQGMSVGNDYKGIVVKNGRKMLNK